MTVHTSQFCSQSSMLDAVSRRDAVTLQTKCFLRLVQQSFVGTTVRLVTFGTPTTLDGERDGSLMLIDVRPTLLRVARVTIGRRAMTVLRFTGSTERMTTQTIYRAIGEGVIRATAKRRTDVDMASAAKLRPIVG